ncbi:sulfite exporter TauE/SafE family protein [Prauserella flavalba]|uniref:Probable membrane transporter protein n=1 Tax=Prauserella flavalba TaxID=1477506 RepID=A0A318LNZ9_9PSEU|nr:sulfite exporter TauE/SafE family protein [Prauserella flavalba]PXY36286.1 hypothetical protein BA062_12770 [Prauserella flavalba]
MLQLLLASAGVLFGAATQRTTGLGFALVATPFLVLVLGPQTGVTLGNLLSASLCALVLTRTWRHLDVRRAALLAVPALVVIPFGAYVVRTLPQSMLLVLVGGLAVVAMLLVAGSERAAVLRGRVGAVVAGALSGFMNVTAGLGGPMITVHALSERWEPARFVATAQAYLLVVNCASLAAKGLPAIPLWTLAAAVVILLLGAVLGERVANRIDRRVAHRLVVVVALLGGLAAIVRGLLTAGD